MLLALNGQEAQGLRERAAMLQEAGVRAEYFPQEDVKQLEPALALPQAGGALLVESDSQLVRSCILPLRLHCLLNAKQHCILSMVAMVNESSLTRFSSTDGLKASHMFTVTPAPGHMA